MTTDEIVGAIAGHYCGRCARGDTLYRHDHEHGQPEWLHPDVPTCSEMVECDASGVWDVATANGVTVLAAKCTCGYDYQAVEG